MKLIDITFKSILGVFVGEILFVI